MVEIEEVSEGTVKLSGRFDATQVESVEKTFAALGGPGRLDLSGLTMISSAGISSLLRHFKSLKARGGELVLVNTPSQVLDVIRYTGLDRVFTIEN